MDAARDNLQEIQALAEQLTAEPFCRKYSLERQSLAKVSLFIEQRETSLERVAPEQDTLKQSFRNFKATYCLLLMQLEALGPLNANQLNSLAIKDYLSGQTLDAMGIQAPGRERGAVDDVTQIGFKPPAPPGLPSHDKTDVTMVGNIINFVQDPTPAPPAMPDPNEPVNGAPVPPADVNWALPEEPSPTPEEEKAQAAAAVAAATQPTTPAAQEYYAMALHFQGLRNLEDPSIPSHHLARLEAQQLCFAIEIEFQEKLTISAAPFWNNRKSLLAPLFDASQKELHPILIRAWESCATQYGVWPRGERMPLLTLKNSLRFLATTTETTPMRPSLIEAGLWLYVLGQHVDLGGLILPNALNLPAFEYDVFADAFLRLCRVHRLKAALVNPSSTFSETERNELETHATALFAFSQAWETSR